MNRNEKRAELRTLMVQVQAGERDMYDVLYKTIEWDMGSVERDDLTHSMKYIQDMFGDDQQAAFRGIHWLMDWVDNSIIL